ncbi:TPA: hypothetical protein ACNVX4_006313 [Pseudomonas aeruginosa]|uniref:hypothetical protein n=1 Tax=Pseudomonas aeruginosa TaxID=287 RepID=UPI0025562134|nr:hypothetical protein [Pseudomonas aeruginosa]EKF7416803.1 hypothetical protein [Pseudomonas aeruginosa]HBO1619498.1 hypothetical protein [Pseudomonas aeruginosa]HBO9385978.1 hypothetical protein [Pseudomonas aeruginosa]HCA5868962.1 hypothetical protein [Pseudomonas aeruginosa]HCA7380194.1 hypothetical protein [Pseudomonas aeruginosa]
MYHHDDRGCPCDIWESWMIQPSEAHQGAPQMAVDPITAAAKRVRETHDRQALHAYIDASFEPYDDVPASTIVKPDSYIQDFPVDLDARIKAMEVRLANAEARAFRSKMRYEEIRTGGLGALNSREIMHNGSGDPKLAINGQLLVLHSHIASDKIVLPRYRELLLAWRKERNAAGHQVELF